MRTRTLAVPSLLAALAGSVLLSPLLASPARAEAQTRLLVHAGRLVDGVSAPGGYVDLKAEMDVLCLFSSCPQVNNPCNGFNPTPIRVMIFDATGE